MRTAILAPEVSPEPGGVADHAARLGESLSPAGPVWFLTRRAPGADRFRYGERFGHEAVSRILAFLEEKRIEVLLIAYVPFLYAPSGVSPSLVRLAGKAAARGIRTLLLLHEPYVPFSLHPVRALRSLAQRTQLKALCRCCDGVTTVCDAWSGIVRPWRQGRSAPVMIPAGSNIPRVHFPETERPALRASLGIPKGETACAVFASDHPSHLTAWTARAAERLRQKGVPLHLVVMGSSSNRWPGNPDPRLHRMGVMEASGISRTLQACDLQAAPYLDGISGRRTAAMAGLEHGLAVLSTLGRLTDSSLPWREHLPLVGANDERAFGERLERLATDPGERRRWAEAGSAFHRDHLDRAKLAREYLDVLGGAGPRLTLRA